MSTSSREFYYLSQEPYCVSNSCQSRSATVITHMAFFPAYITLYFFIFSFIFISWRLITLQYCSGFCHTLTWISHGFTCIPHPDPPRYHTLKSSGLQNAGFLLPCGLCWLPFSCGLSSVICPMCIVSSFIIWQISNSPIISPFTSLSSGALPPHPGCHSPWCAYCLSVCQPNRDCSWELRGSHLSDNFLLFSLLICLCLFLRFYSPCSPGTTLLFICFLSHDIIQPLSFGRFLDFITQNT